MWDWLTYSDVGILTPNQCKPLDSAADGYVTNHTVRPTRNLIPIVVSFVRGEGAAAIVIKPLEAALADNDHIYAVVRSNPFNSTHSLLTPSYCALGRFWARLSITTGQTRHSPSLLGSCKSSAFVMPFRMLGGILVMSIMLNFTQPVCCFRSILSCHTS